jgi:hypothetical protein
MDPIRRVLEFSTRDRFIVAFIALGLGAAACWAFASQFENSDHVLGFIGMIGLASLLVGALAGFLALRHETWVGVLLTAM